MFTTDKFGKRLAAIRTERGMSQEQLGELCDISTAMIGRYERGDNSPRLDQLVRLADALDCSLDVLAARVDIT